MTASYPQVLVDPAARALRDPSTQSFVGRPRPTSQRLLWALPLGQSGMKRYQPSFAPSEACNVGMDFSFIVPFGVGLTGGALTIMTNVANPVPVPGDFVVSPVTVLGRAIYAMVSGGVRGTDYQFHWTAFDANGDEWPRAALMLCAWTS